MRYLILIVLAASMHSHAEGTICGKVKSKYRYSLSENDFTKENFEQALVSLKTTDAANAYDYDFYDIESDLMYIKGYMFKLHIKNNPDNPAIVKQFCDFMSTEAYMRHE